MIRGRRKIIGLGSPRRAITIPPNLVTGDVITFAANNFLLVDLYGKHSPDELVTKLRKIEMGVDE